jgi:hypothetical protein
MKSIGQVCVPMDKKQIKNCQMPESLRQYYCIAGKTSINSRHHKLLDPGDHYQINQYTIFMRESQGVVEWGWMNTDVDKVDPIVYQRNVRSGDWYPEPYEISNFLMAAWIWLETGRERPREQLLLSVRGN